MSNAVAFLFVSLETLWDENMVYLISQYGYTTWHISNNHDWRLSVPPRLSFKGSILLLRIMFIPWQEANKGLVTKYFRISREGTDCVKICTTRRSNSAYFMSSNYITNESSLFLTNNPQLINHRTRNSANMHIIYYLNPDPQWSRVHGRCNTGIRTSTVSFHTL